MSAIASRRRVADPAPESGDSIDHLVALRAATELVTVARELLLLFPQFECAFPRETTLGRALGVAGAIRRILRRDGFAPLLTRSLRRGLEALLDRPGERTALPSKSSILGLADASLRRASELAPDAAAPHVVQAQRAWMFGSSAGTVRDALEDARTRVTSPSAAAVVLVHLAILRADSGAVDEAIELLDLASRLDPRSLAAHWTCAAYSVAVGRRSRLDRHLLVIGDSPIPSAVRRRALALHAQFAALARIGVLPPTRARERADRFLSLLPPIAVARTQP